MRLACEPLWPCHYRIAPGHPRRAGAKHTELNPSLGLVSPTSTLCPARAHTLGGEMSPVLGHRELSGLTQEAGQIHTQQKSEGQALGTAGLLGMEGTRPLQVLLSITEARCPLSPKG